jgi:hypothetical protein
MITMLLTAAGFIRSATTTKPAASNAHRARWRGSDGQWQWAAVAN